MKAYLAPLGRVFCEHKNRVCDSYATHTVSLEGIGSLGGRYCEQHAQGIADLVNAGIAKGRESREGDVRDR